MKEFESDNDHIADQTDDHLDNQVEEIDEPRKSKRVRTAKSFGSDLLTYMLEGEPRTFS